MVDSPSASIEAHRWTREQYEKIVEAGVLSEDDRVELLDGQILTMSPQNSRHATVVTLCRKALENSCPENFFVRTQAPLALGPYSEPEPDVALIPGDPDSYWDRHPNRAELVVEISDTSLERDRVEKRALYARHDIPEYWIVNLIDSHLEVYRSPGGDDYASKTTLTQADEVTIRALSCSPISVSQFIPQ